MKKQTYGWQKGNGLDDHYHEWDNNQNNGKENNRCYHDEEIKNNTTINDL